MMSTFFARRSRRMERLLRGRTTFLQLNEDPNKFNSDCRTKRDRVIRALNVDSPFHPGKRLRTRRLIFVVTYRVSSQFERAMSILSHIMATPRATRLVTTMLSRINVRQATQNRGRPMTIFRHLRRLIFTIITPPRSSDLIKESANVSRLIPTSRHLTLKDRSVNDATSGVLFRTHFITWILVFSGLLSFKVNRPALITMIRLITSSVSVKEQRRNSSLIRRITSGLRHLFLTKVRHRVLPFTLTSTKSFEVKATSDDDVTQRIRFKGSRSITVNYVNGSLLSLFLNMRHDKYFQIIPITSDSFNNRLQVALSLSTPTQFINRIPIRSIRTGKHRSVRVLFCLLFARRITTLIRRRATPTMTKLVLCLANARIAFTRAKGLRGNFLHVRRTNFKENLRRSTIQFSSGHVNFVNRLTVIYRFRASNSANK